MAATVTETEWHFDPSTTPVTIPTSTNDLTSTSTVVSLTTTFDTTTTTSLATPSGSSTSMPSNSTSTQSDPSEMDAGKIAASVLGAVLIVAILVGGAIWLRRRDAKRKKQQEEAILLQHRGPQEVAVDPRYRRGTSLLNVDFLPHELFDNLLLQKRRSATSVSEAMLAGNHTEHVGWVNNQTRGTSDILFGCVSTLVICVYTALHMNITLCNKSKTSKFAHHTWWILVGVFAPEIILIAASTQHAAAARLQQEIDRRRRSGALPDDVNDKRWRSVFSHFVLMGGYQLVHITTEQKHALRMEPDCVVELLGHAQFKPLGLQEIEARSRASTLAKSLSAIQASWLAVQVAGRLGQGLPVTELEVNTIAHISCALLAWLYWLRKPYDVDSPQEIRLDDTLGGFVAGLCLMRHGTTEQIFAELLWRRTEESHNMSNVNISDFWEPRRVERRLTTSTLLEHMCHAAGDIVVLEWSACANKQNLVQYRQQRKEAKYVLLLESRSTAEIDWAMNNFDEVYGQDLPPIIVIALGDGATEVLPDPGFKLEDRGKYIHVVADQFGYLLHQRFWTEPELSKLLANLIRSVMDYAHPDRREVRAYGCRSFLATKDPVFRDNIWSDTPWQTWLTGLAMTAVYGSIHAALWNAHFPTDDERWLWRISSIVVLSPLLILGICWIGTRATKRLSSLVDWIVILISTPLVPLALPAARLFLVVESFISLRSQPIEVYQQVNWTQYIPHI
ncbi:uncharacterized protein AB675_7804 [Cyphellophora attinorum]|uniref:Uncharacterized protein n=1 Tax=Cyphellophora attinorum TaxID=1664694 RepID=A0A0N0NML6_9EURO|nr:uncharacterized protein AB675_7804 [Phialophora attinorum]KPI40349.1 hypothetical protein AB675_7804 [Phialophora attinorum]